MTGGLALTARASRRVNGRCVDCGRFSGDSLHFHAPRSKFRGRPKVHLYRDGGGVVTRCDDVDQALALLREAYSRDAWSSSYSQLEPDLRADVDRALDRGQLRVTKGRMVVQAPDGDYTWLFMPLAETAQGPGVTTAVEWIVL